MTGLEYKFALIAKYDNGLVSDIEITDLQTRIPKTHITLIGGKTLKPFKAEMKAFDFTTLANPPSPIIGKVGVAHRVVNEEERITTVVGIQNQSEFCEYVSNLCEAVGIENPDGGRFFHISVANNHGGNPFKSVGDICMDDTYE